MKTESMLTREETVSGGKIRKVDRYNWAVQDSPGDLRMVNKSSLLVDHAYQRTAKEAKLLSIARNWSWVACGAIVVADREGVLYVIDGQHRVLAARKRHDIVELPCIVFRTQAAKQEAKGFLAAQLQRKAITSIEKFRALITVEDPAALIVQSLLADVGKSAGDGKTASSVRCIAILLKWADTDPDLLRETWPLIVEASGDDSMKDRLVDGLLYIAKNMPEGQRLTDRVWSSRVLKVGGRGLLEGAAKAAAYYAAGGAKVWAKGMVTAINRGHRNLLELPE